MEVISLILNYNNQHLKVCINYKFSLWILFACYLKCLSNLVCVTCSVFLVVFFCLFVCFYWYFYSLVQLYHNLSIYLLMDICVSSLSGY